MESNRITCNCRYARFAVARLFVFSCLLTCGCAREISSTQQVSSADYDPQKERIEHVVGAGLPVLIEATLYHSDDANLSRRELCCEHREHSR